jgi:hypothetical protein
MHENQTISESAAKRMASGSLKSFRVLVATVPGYRDVTASRAKHGKRCAAPTFRMKP